jgi:hypothetical protein
VAGAHGRRLSTDLVNRALDGSASIVGSLIGLQATSGAKDMGSE